MLFHQLPEEAMSTTQCCEHELVAWLQSLAFLQCSAPLACLVFECSTLSVHCSVLCVSEQCSAMQVQLQLHQFALCVSAVRQVTVMSRCATLILFFCRCCTSAVVHCSGVSN
eukprot:3733675-Amphidinium_carterae.2